MRLTAPRLQAALGTLLLRPGAVVPVDHLVESIWEDEVPSDPTNQVAACISMLRRRFRQHGVDHDIIDTVPPGYRLRTEKTYIDTTTVLQMRAVAQEQLTSGSHEAALTSLQSALSLWRGPVLSGISRRTWVSETRRWDEEYVQLQKMRCGIQFDLGMYDDLVTELTPFIEKHPLLENFRAMLMSALAHSGRQADALQLYRDTAHLLREELGVTPGREIRELHERILRGDTGSPEAARPGVPTTSSAASAEATHTGHASNSMASDAAPAAPVGPESAHAAPVPSDAPTPAQAVRPQERSGATPDPKPLTAARTPSGPCQLPGDLAEFTGRQAEAEFLEQVLAPRAGSVPLVLLVGAGGTGKTALAVHVAHRLRSVFPDGQLYVNLRGMSEQPVSPEATLARFLRELRLPSPLPETLDERAESLRSLLADRRMLLVLDDAGDAEQVLPLLPGTGSCAVIVTSRFRLTTLPGGKVLELDVFRQPQALTLLSLLIGHERMAAEPDVAEQLVEYCGRLPLAVRILGAKLASKPHWPLWKVATRLADERTRLDELAHENLGVRASLELSHQGIRPSARMLFRRLALLTLPDFADWVCAPLTDLPVDDAEELLEELLDARLLDVVSPEDAGEPRYRMHDLVRLYAREQVAELEPEEERTAALTRLGVITLALADSAHRNVCGGDFTVVHSLARPPAVPAEILDRVGQDPLAWYQRDRTTVAALCQQLAESGQDELAWDLAATCRCQFSVCFHFDEWRLTHELALKSTRQQGNERGSAAMLLGLGDLHLTRRDYDRAIPLLKEARELFRKVGDDHGHALAQRKVACGDRIQGRFQEALAGWQQCLPVLYAVGDIEAQAQVLRWSGQTLLEMGRTDEAWEMLQEARSTVEGFSGRSTAQVRLSLGEQALVRGELSQAEEDFSWGLAATSRNGDLSGHCYALWGLGWIDVLRENLIRAEERLREARELAHRIHDPLLESDIVYGLATARRMSGDPAGAAALLETGAALCREMNAPARLARFTRDALEIRSRDDSSSAGTEEPCRPDGRVTGGPASGTVTTRPR
ncbi:BTAD domain-containing putative transcriptional regulator [Streptomyces sp. NPDC005209]|uniref:AfsR/SARP family transcriptional regulator n=1 Tax=Streptomyces sp. NPDC005209 TaxID=3156715 RepID=UPI00339F407F